MTNRAFNLSPLGVSKIFPGLAERYKLIGSGPIGERSGFGAVWRALDRWLGREVAIKISESDLSDEILLCRDIEVQTVRIFDFFRGNDGWNGYAMDLLRDPWITVSKFIDKRHEKPKANNLQHYFDCFEVAHHALLGLKGIHKKSHYQIAGRYVHADIKPANIFLLNEWKKHHASVFRMRRDESVVKIIDFGISKSDGFEISAWTPAYFPPGTTVAHPGVDLYALGVTFVELLTGAIPSRDARSHVAKIRALINARSSGSRWIDRVAVEFARRCLRASKNRKERAESLIQYLNSELFELDPRVLIALRSINSKLDEGLKKAELAHFLFEPLREFSGWANKTESRLSAIEGLITDMYERDMLVRVGTRYFVR